MLRLFNLFPPQGQDRPRELSGKGLSLVGSLLGGATSLGQSPRTTRAIGTPVGFRVGAGEDVRLSESEPDDYLAFSEYLGSWCRGAPGEYPAERI